ncbi:MAG: hypothetical protein CMN76_13465 [Spirochaetaceae bacterium]|nr:hypothetical protein [Spirochaetaceae bacterium]
MQIVSPDCDRLKAWLMVWTGSDCSAPDCESAPESKETNMAFSSAKQEAMPSLEAVGSGSTGSPGPVVPGTTESPSSGGVTSPSAAHVSGSEGFPVQTTLDIIIIKNKGLVN